MAVPGPGPIDYLPVSLDAGGQASDVCMIKLAAGRVARTALDRLVDWCGVQQPWSIFDVAHLDDVKDFDGDVGDAASGAWHAVTPG